MRLMLACLSWKGMAGAQTWQACCLEFVEELCKVSCPTMPFPALSGCVMAAVLRLLSLQVHTLAWAAKIHLGKLHKV